MMAFSLPSQRQQPLTPITPSMSLDPDLPIVQESFTPLPITPPDPETVLNSELDVEAINTAVHVISTERAALQHIERLYTSDKTTQKAFALATKHIANAIRKHGKLVICGVGKSGKIGEKAVATMNSLGIESSFLHPTEALHGDLGMIKHVCWTLVFIEGLLLTMTD